MRIRNLCRHRKTKAFMPVIFPYAGVDKARGQRIEANGLSRELPPERFFDPLLQRDWKNGAIEVLFDEVDRAVLGGAIDGLVSSQASAPSPTVVLPRVRTAQPVPKAKATPWLAAAPTKVELATQPDELTLNTVPKLSPTPPVAPPVAPPAFVNEQPQHLPPMTPIDKIVKPATGGLGNLAALTPDQLAAKPIVRPVTKVPVLDLATLRKQNEKLGA